MAKDSSSAARGMAQSGSAPVLGAGGPRFESLCPDHGRKTPLHLNNNFPSEGKPKPSGVASRAWLKKLLRSP